MDAFRSVLTLMARVVVREVITTALQEGMG